METKTDSQRSKTTPPTETETLSSYPSTWSKLDSEPVRSTAAPGPLRSGHLRRLRGMLDDQGTGGASELYAALRTVLDSAYNQAAIGKGRERHADAGESFDSQFICRGQRTFGIGGGLFQATKKTEEAFRFTQRGETERAIAELKGAINYIAATIIVLEEM